jgi:hypothetical protein
MLAFLVVGSDPLGWQGLDVVDPQNIANRVRAGHARAASVTPFRLVLLVYGTAGIANEERCGRKFPPSSVRTPGGSFARYTRKARPS